MYKPVALHDGKENGSNEISGFSTIQLNKPEPETCFHFFKRNENLNLEGNVISDSQVASMHIK